MRSLLCCLAFLVLALGCGEKKPPQLEKQSGDKLKGAMWQISADTGTLFDLMSVEKPDDKAIAEARRLLDDIAARGAALQAVPELKEHPLLGVGLPRFLDEVATARAALDRTPPQTLAAKSISESCKTCHRVATTAVPSEARLAIR